MKFLFAPDSFKGSLSALEVARALDQVARAHFDGLQTLLVPVADGGEGTVDAILTAAGGERRALSVCGPMGEAVKADYALLNNGAAVMEMAACSGLPLVAPEKRNPLKATSRGTGELINHLLNSGVRELLIGIGGSATNDGGMGMLRALGARFYDENGREAPEGGEGLERVSRVDLGGLNPLVKEANITVICDVTNPLLGPDGATNIYGPQKGASGDMLIRLEKGMASYACAFEKAGMDIAHFPGAGAAGGMGAALGGVLGAHLKSGIDAVLEAVGFDALLEGVDLVVTGEGRIDEQSVRFGKVPTGVARRCAAKNIPVIALVGGIGPGAQAYYDLGDTTIMTIVNGPIALKQSMAEAGPLLRDAADRLFRALKIGMTLSSGKA